MYEAAIAAGIKYLDERLGLAWVFQINLDTLRMSKCDVCVCGQLGLDEKDLRADIDCAKWIGFSRNLGFNTRDSGLDPEDFYYRYVFAELHYAALTKEWKVVIASLQESRKDLNVASS